MNKKCKVITLTNQKGGVSKTTTCANLAVLLAKFGYQVLMIDMDSQCNLTQQFDSVKAPDISNIMTTDKLPISKTQEGVDIVPAHPQLAIEGLNAALIKQGRIKALVDSARTDYDFILIDTAPSISQLHIEIMAATDYVIIPAQSNAQSLEGVKSTFYYLRKLKQSGKSVPSILGILLTIFDKRKNIQTLCQSVFKSTFENMVFDTVIPQDVKAEESFLVKQTLVTRNPNSKAAIAYTDLTNEILKKLK